MVSFALSDTIQAVRERMHEFAENPTAAERNPLSAVAAEELGWGRAGIMEIFEGTGEIQRTIIAQDLTGLDCK